MRRMVAILLTVWVLMAGPALCQAGLLEHECACPDCAGACPDEGCPAGRSCQGDPCGTHVIHHRLAHADDEAGLAPLPACAAFLADRPFAAGPGVGESVPLATAVPGDALPFAQQSPPLLV